MPACHAGDRRFESGRVRQPAEPPPASAANLADARVADALLGAQTEGRMTPADPLDTSAVRSTPRPAAPDAPPPRPRPRHLPSRGPRVRCCCSCSARSRSWRSVLNARRATGRAVGIAHGRRRHRRSRAGRPAPPRSSSSRCRPPPSASAAPPASAAPDLSPAPGACPEPSPGRVARRVPRRRIASVAPPPLAGRVRGPGRPSLGSRRSPRRRRCDPVIAGTSLRRMPFVPVIRYWEATDVHLDGTTSRQPSAASRPTGHACSSAQATAPLWSPPWASPSTGRSARRPRAPSSRPSRRARRWASCVPRMSSRPCGRWPSTAATCSATTGSAASAAGRWWRRSRPRPDEAWDQGQHLDHGRRRRLVHRSWPLRARRATQEGRRLPVRRWHRPRDGPLHLQRVPARERQLHPALHAVRPQGHRPGAGQGRRPGASSTTSSRRRPTGSSTCRARPSAASRS